MNCFIIILVALVLAPMISHDISRRRAALPRRGQWWVSRDDPDLYALVQEVEGGLIDFDLYDVDDEEPWGTQILPVDLFMYNYR